MRPPDLADSAEDCFLENGYYGISTWGLPGDTIQQAAARLPAPFGQIRAARRKDLEAAGYELRGRPDGHCSIVMYDGSAIADCEALAALFLPPIPNPALQRKSIKGRKR
jgi:hypothetical protein